MTEKIDNVKWDIIKNENDFSKFIIKYPEYIDMVLEPEVLPIVAFIIEDVPMLILPLALLEEIVNSQSYNNLLN